jgi:thiamine-monophosphate kinase
MHELHLLSHIYQRSADLTSKFPRVRVGPGDDCAVVTSARGDPLLLKVDQVIEGRHFTSATPLDFIARKAIARAVSDIAAMAGTPIAALAAAAVPTSWSNTRADELFDAAAAWARRFNCPLVGGDISTTTGPLSLSITVLGELHATRGPVLRSGALPGDFLYVTGALGASLDSTTGLGHHLTFEPRVPEATWLAETLGADLHAMLDLSDGLGLDSGRLAHASGVVLELDAARLPLRAGADLRGAISDGEDYELLFAAAPNAPLPSACPTTGTPITRIGTVTAGALGSFLIKGATRTDISSSGWEHTS